MVAHLGQHCSQSESCGSNRPRRRRKLGRMPVMGGQQGQRSPPAPVIAVIGYDIDFHEELPWLFPHTDAKSWFGWRRGRPQGRRISQFLPGKAPICARCPGDRTGLRARCSGFDADAAECRLLRREPGHRANFILRPIGYGDTDSIFDRSPRPGDFPLTFNRYRLTRICPVAHRHVLRGIGAGPCGCSPSKPPPRPVPSRCSTMNARLRASTTCSGAGHAEALVPMIAALPDKGRADRILVSALARAASPAVRIGLATAARHWALRGGARGAWLSHGSR